MSAERQMPASVDVERAVLGACIQSREATEQVRGTLLVESFYSPAHRCIWNALCNLSERGDSVDQVSVVEELTKLGHLEEVGGAFYIAKMVGEVATTAHVEHHARIVLGMSVRRQLIVQAEQVRERAFDLSEDVTGLVADAGRSLRALEFGDAEVWVQMRDELDRVHGQVVAAHADPNGAVGVKTGLPDLDDMLNGLQRGELILLAARPSMGKTHVALAMVREAAKRVPVGVVSVEMNNDSLILRMIAAQAKVDGHIMRRGGLSDFAQSAVSQAVIDLRPLNVFLSDRLREPVRIGAEARKLKRDADIGLLVVDYLQLLSPPAGRKFDSREREVASIGKALKDLAVELHIPILTVAQLSRAVESRSDKRPVLSDLRDSGSLEQDADVVLFLYRPEYYGLTVEDGDPPIEGVLEVHVAKNRQGPVGTVETYFDPSTGRLGERTETYAF